VTQPQTTAKAGQPATEPEAQRDPRLDVALRNWSFRFVANGVDFGDFQETTRRIQTWDDWPTEWATTAQRHEATASAAEQAGRARTSAEAWRRAGISWHFSKFLSVEDEERAAAAQQRLNHCFDRGLWALEPPGQRIRVPYADIDLAGILRRPEGRGPFPVAVLLAGLDSTKEELQTLADVLLRREIATVAIDGPGQGEAERRLDIEPASERWVTPVIDVLSSHSDLDVGRTGIVGVSLGGYYAVRAAAFEPRIQAAVDISGPHRIADVWDALPPMTRSAYRQRTGSSDEGQARSRVAALDLTGVTAKVQTPLLVVHGHSDPLVPYTQAARIVADAPRGELLEFADGNHGLTNRVFEARSGLADWLAEHLAAVKPTPAHTERMKGV
jgi:pimeloyl-ACP methyl ester carboxylesterase